MARLPQGVRKRSDGVFEKRFTIKGNRYSVYAGNTKELAEKEHELRNQIEQGLYIPKSKTVFDGISAQNIKLDDYFTRWLDRKRIMNKKENSLRLYKSIYDNHISNQIGRLKIRDIERAHILEIQKNVALSCSATTCNYVLTVLKIVLNDAIKDEIITRNVTNGIEALKNDEKATESYHRALTVEELNVFLEEAKSNYYYEFFKVALFTGMRLGEMTALTWADIDEKNNVIHITKTVSFGMDNKRIIGKPKSNKGKRDILLTDEVKALLYSQRKKMSSVVKFDKSDLVFMTPFENVIYNRTINIEIDKILQSLKEQGQEIEHFTAHAFRDTYATEFIAQGGSPYILQRLLGHSSVKQTEKYVNLYYETIMKETQKIKMFKDIKMA